MRAWRTLEELLLVKGHIEKIGRRCKIAIDWALCVKMMGELGTLIRADGILCEMLERKCISLASFLQPAPVPVRIMLNLKGRGRKLTFIK